MTSKIRDTAQGIKNFQLPFYAFYISFLERLLVVAGRYGVVMSQDKVLPSTVYSQASENPDQVLEIFIRPK